MSVPDVELVSEWSEVDAAAQAIKNGVQKSQMAASVQTSLGKADSALQSTTGVTRAAQAAKTPGMTAPVGIDEYGRLFADTFASIEAKDALLALLAKCAYVTDDAQADYDRLVTALSAKLDYIVADYEQDRPIYDTDSLDAIKVGDDLIVTAYYDDGTHIELADSAYTLSGALTAGTSTITVSYGGKTDTIMVVVTHKIEGWYYPFNGSLLSSGTEDFNLSGEAVYDTGRLGTDLCYKHFVPTPGTASSDTQKGLYATGLTKTPNLGGDFTVAFWMKTQIDKFTHVIGQTIYVDATSPTNRYFSSVVMNDNTWTLESNAGNANAYAGFMIQGATSSGGKLLFRFSNGTLTASSTVTLLYPQSVNTTTWHHYAITRKGNTVRFFFDGVLVCTATTSETTIYNSGQISFSGYFGNTEQTKSEMNTTSNGECIQDMFIAEYCKWESAFDPSAIEY